MKSRRKATLLNITFTTLYHITTAIFGFIIPSMLLSTYGANIHGYTSTVNSILNYIALINAGLAPAAVQALYAPLANKNHKRLNEVLNAINKFYVKSGYLYTLAVLTCAGILPFILSNQLPSYQIIGIMISIGATNILDCFIYSKYKILLQADQKLYVVSAVDTLMYFFRVGIQVFLIYRNYSIIVVLGVPAVVLIFRTLFLYLYTNKAYQFINRNIKPDNKSLDKRWSAMIHQVAGLVVYNTDVTLLTLFGSLIEVSIYSVYNLVFSHLYNVLTSVFSHGIVASIGQLLYEDKKQTVIKAFDMYEYVYYAIVSFVYGVTSIMILPFVGLYTKSTTNIQYVDPTLAILFLIIGLANNIRVPSGTLINAAGHFKETQFRSLLEAIINIVSSLILMKFLGMKGLLVGTIISFAYRSTDIIYYSHSRILKISCKQTVLRVIRLVVCIITSYFIVSNIIKIENLQSWMGWISYAFVASGITFFIVLGMNILFEYSLMLNVLKLVIKRTQ